MPTTEAILPHGVWRDRAQHRSASLRWPGDAAERTLVEQTSELLPAERVSELIARQVEVDGITGARLARELTAGDRAALLLHLRRLALGDTLVCVFPCPNDDCGERLELELSVSELLVDPAEDPAPAHELELAEGRVRFRLPTGSDEERAALRALDDPVAAADELLAACVLDAPEPEPQALRERVPASMAELDPQADLTLAFSCPECERSGVVPFDPASFFFAELEARAEALERDVHTLAAGYGWSEEEILSLPSARRRRYVARVEAGGK
jgi:hypothetical protein